MADSTPGKAQPCGDLEWRTWGDHSVVFHVPSGHTHLLDPVAATGLRCLETSPAGVEELAARMAASLDIEVDDALRSYVGKLLARFTGAGLVEMRTDV
jgi:PqqD family protein of HPr-rel-A system